MEQPEPVADLMCGGVTLVVWRRRPARQALVEQYDPVVGQGGVEGERGVSEQAIGQARDVDVQVVEAAPVQGRLGLVVVVGIDVRVDQLYQSLLAV